MHQNRQLTASLNVGCQQDIRPSCDKDPKRDLKPGLSPGHAFGHHGNHAAVQLQDIMLLESYECYNAMSCNQRTNCNSGATMERIASLIVLEMIEPLEILE